MQTRFPDKRSHWCKQSPMFFDEDQVFPLSGNRKTCYYSWVQVCHTRQDVVALVLSVNYACFVCLLQGIQIKSYMQNNVLQETDVLLHQLFWELPHIFMQYNIPGIICWSDVVDQPTPCECGKNKDTAIAYASRKCLVTACAMWQLKSRLIVKKTFIVGPSSPSISPNSLQSWIPENVE